MVRVKVRVWLQVYLLVIFTDNTKRRAGRPFCQMKNMNFLWAGKLHRRAGRQAALQDGPVGCTLRRAAQ